MVLSIILGLVGHMVVRNSGPFGGPLGEPLGGPTGGPLREPLGGPTGGPFAEPYEFHGRMDNHTLEEMDIGAFGGKTLATVARSRDNSIINYVRKPKSADLFFTVSDTIHPHDKNILIIKYRHVESNVV